MICVSRKSTSQKKSNLNTKLWQIRTAAHGWGPPSASLEAVLGGAVRTEPGPECGSPWALCEGRRAPPASWAACCWPSNPWRGPVTPSSGPAGCEYCRACCQGALGVCSAARSWCRAVLLSGWERAPPVGRGWGDPVRQRPPPGRKSGAAGWGNGLMPGCETQWPEWKEDIGLGLHDYGQSNNHDHYSQYWNHDYHSQLLIMLGQTCVYCTFFDKRYVNNALLILNFLFEVFYFQ